MAHFVISANRTADGGVLYLTADRSWTTRLASAAPFPGKPDAAAGLAWARTQEAFACDPHLIKVKPSDAGPRPLDAKQSIRAAGPEAILTALGFLDAKPDARHIHRSELPDDAAAAPDTSAADAGARV